ncbi:transglycosylase domain-containing protein [Novosphingobium album (ex Liu et al. 2023)]|uniref:transglycosylase domain-containing protein n=1 Tax=Novosphingobium album (ex Liu et al. 2023) TaxID=3031130 RepID=UPI0023B0CF02|nr:transglycosylase domain-containing protein [Novosphingobium album (ex Liu et al. 2023)]
MLLIAGLLAYGAKGYRDAVNDAPALARRADRLMAAGRGPEALGPGRIDQLLAVEDRGFVRHHGVDLDSRGAGKTTLTQSLAKRLAFDRFAPGVKKIRQTGYAMGLESRLTKRQIIALWLDTAQMGRGPNGWMTGFFTASRQAFGQPPAALDQRRFLSLVAVGIAPRRFDLFHRDTALENRVGRIERLVAGTCRPTGNGDVWLEGCAGT